MKIPYRSSANPPAYRNTVKLNLRQLVQQGYLEQHGTGKGMWYSVRRYIEIAKAADWPPITLQ